MNLPSLNLIIVSPELILVSGILIILLCNKIQLFNKYISAITTLILLSVYIVQIILSETIHNQHISQLAFNNMFILDALAQGFKTILNLFTVMIMFYIKEYLANRKTQLLEFYVLFLFAILGMMIMISANHMIVLYLGLEMLSLALYALIVLPSKQEINPDTHQIINYPINENAAESAMKLFILGSLASAILLFGISFIYGATNGQLQLNLIMQAITQDQQNTNLILLSIGLVFIVIALAFKFGLAPFHAWLPDVYQGSSLAVTTIIATITKLAVIVFIIRFLINGLMPLVIYWSTMLMVLAILSLFIGNILAISQTNIKRMLAYSAIAHMGFIALGFINLDANALNAILNYTIVYVFTNLMIFAILLLLSNTNYECENIQDLRVLSKNHPIYAIILLIAIFSLAGIPPLVGFYAKLTILQHLIHIGYNKLAIFAVIMSLIGTFYYLRIIKVMYFDNNNLANIQINSTDNSIKQLNNNKYNIGIATKIILTINITMIIATSIFPNLLLTFCMKLITN